MGKAILIVVAILFMSSLLCLFVLLGAYFVTDYFGVGMEPTRMTTKGPTASLTKPVATATFTPSIMGTPTRTISNTPTMTPTKKVVVQPKATTVLPPAKPAPFLASVFPPYGPKDGRVWLRGSNFGESAGKVYFWCYGSSNSTDSGILSWSNLEIVAVTPKLRQGGHCSIRVINSEWVYSNEVYFTIEVPETETPVIEPTATVVTRTSTPTLTLTRTPTRTLTRTLTVLPTVNPTATITPTVRTVPTATPSQTSTVTPSRTLTVTVTPTR